MSTTTGSSWKRFWCAIRPGCTDFRHRLQSRWPMRASDATKKNNRRWAATVAVLLAVAAALPVPARAEDFYKGKTINLFIGSGPGGGYDQFGRLVARHLGTFVAGQPTVVPHNMPGAGSISAANFVYNNAPQDE